jgi:hypothetical protein
VDSWSRVERVDVLIMTGGCLATGRRSLRNS